MRKGKSKRKLELGRGEARNSWRFELVAIFRGVLLTVEAINYAEENNKVNIEASRVQLNSIVIHASF